MNLFNTIAECTQNDIYWRVLVLKAWGTLSESLTPPPSPVKDLYRLHWKSFKNVCINLRLFGLGSSSDLPMLSPSFRALISSS